MPINKAGRYTFQKSSSAYQQAEAWRARRRDANQSFLAVNQDASNRLNAAWTSQIEGRSSLVATAALERIKAATALAKEASANNVNLTV